MRLIKRGLIVFALFSAPFLLLAGAFVIYDRIENARYEEFYDQHPMLRTMRDTAWMDMTTVLLQRVPVGSTRSDALHVLSTEDIECEPGNNPLKPNPPKPNAFTPYPQKPNPLKPELLLADTLVCHSIKNPRIRRVPAWYIELRFDGNDRVAGGNAMRFKSGA
jgi:hypothetical protein